MITLLAVDDSSTMRKVLEITFAGEAFKTVLAANEQDALDRLYDSQAPIALVDITLGQTSGYDLCQKIKSAAPGTRVVLLASKQHPYDAARGAAVGADDHVDKPFDTQAMIDKVRALAASAPAAQPPAPPPAPAQFVPAAQPQYIVSQTQPATKLASEPPALGASQPPVSSRSEPPAEQPEARRHAPEPLASPEPLVEPPAAFTAPAVRPYESRPPTAVPPSAPRVAVGLSAAAPSDGQTANLAGKLGALGLTPEQVQAVLALSREVVEQAVWEVVPTLAETLIREEIQRLTRE
ncbi:MAG: hypothetical protein RJA70_1347 [Pseudomonadota bacterium]